jgi:hypothetical protein
MKGGFDLGTMKFNRKYEKKKNKLVQLLDLFYSFLGVLIIIGLSLYIMYIITTTIVQTICGCLI